MNLKSTDYEEFVLIPTLYYPSPIKLQPEFYMNSCKISSCDFVYMHKRKVIRLCSRYCIDCINSNSFSGCMKKNDRLKSICCAAVTIVYSKYGVGNRGRHTKMW